MRKIVIFGSTGRTGVCALEAAVKKGLSVRAFVRNPAKVPENLKDKVEIVKGDVLSDLQSVNNAVEGMDGAIIILGTGESLGPTTDMSVGTKNILDALVKKNVPIVSVCMSAYLWYVPEKIPRRFHNLNEDHKRMLKIVKDCPLDWIAVLPPHIDDEPNGNVILQVNPKETPGRVVSKWDLSKFLVDCLSEPKYYKSLIGICNAPWQ